jgi:hypothetical protein
MFVACEKLATRPACYPKVHLVPQLAYLGHKARAENPAMPPSLAESLEIRTYPAIPVHLSRDHNR